jgi:hypothetical protein
MPQIHRSKNIQAKYITGLMPDAEDSKLLLLLKQENEEHNIFKGLRKKHTKHT